MEADPGLDLTPGCEWARSQTDSRERFASDLVPREPCVFPRLNPWDDRGAILGIEGYMLIKDICHHDVVTIGPRETVGRAAQLMRQHHVGNVVIAGTGTGRPVPLGIITDRDLVVGVLAREVPNPASLHLEDIMSRTLHTVSESASLADAQELMLAHGVRRLPVIDHEGFLVGIVAFDDLLYHMSSQLHDLSRLFVLERRRETGRRPS